MRKPFICLIFFFIGTVSLKAQSWGDSTYKRKRVFFKTEVMPQFPGGQKGIYEFFEKHSRLAISKEPFSSNKNVIAEVVIDTSGNVVYANIIQGIKENYNNEVIEVLKKMPAWKPALQNGKAVPILLTIPVTFKP